MLILIEIRLIIFNKYKNSEKVAISSKRRFSFGNALKNLFKGIISPVTMIIQNPLAALPMIAAGAAFAFFVPATIPLMLVAGIGFSAFELGKGVIKFTSSSSNGDAQGMEDSFKDIGAGAIGTVLSIFGIRGTAAIAAEAKAASTVLRAGSTEIEAVQAGLNAAKEAKSIGLLSAFKENFSMFSGSGLRAARDSFRLRRVKRAMNTDPNASSKTQSVSSTNGSNSTSSSKGLDELKHELDKIGLKFDLKIDPIAAEARKRLFELAERLKIKEIKAIANDFYSKEITKMAQRLGISESRLRQILPRIDYCEKGLSRFIVSLCEKKGGIILAGGITNPNPIKWGFSYIINPKCIRSCPKLDDYVSILKEYGSLNRSSVESLVNSWIKEIILDIVSHECKHLERALFGLKHLRWSEYSTVANQQAANAFGNERVTSLNGLGRFVTRVISFFENRSGVARKLRSPRTTSTQTEVKEAIAILKDRIDVRKANAVGFGESAYFNCAEEVSARMHSMLRRLEVLNEEMQVLVNRMGASNFDKTNLLNQRIRLRVMERELRHECSGFLNPERAEARTQLEKIKALIASITQRLG